MNFLYKARDMILAIHYRVWAGCYVAGFVLLACLLFKMIIESFVPSVVIIIITLFSIASFSTGVKNIILSTGGVVLLATSWLVNGIWDSMTVNLICFLGILSWSTAVVRSILEGPYFSSSHSPRPRDH